MKPTAHQVTASGPLRSSNFRFAEPVLVCEASNTDAIAGKAPGGVRADASTRKRTLAYVRAKGRKPTTVYREQFGAPTDSGSRQLRRCVPYRTDGALATG